MTVKQDTGLRHPYRKVGTSLNSKHSGQKG